MGGWRVLKHPSAIFFAEFPSEVKLEIISYLSLGNVLNMRLLCRDLALLASINLVCTSGTRASFGIDIKDEMHETVYFVPDAQVAGLSTAVTDSEWIVEIEEIEFDIKRKKNEQPSY